jgi:hypothetical protein
MLKWLGHPSIPFLTAAIAALVLYRLLETGFGLSGGEIFATGLGGAVLIGVGLGLASLVPRQE